MSTEPMLKLRDHELVQEAPFVAPPRWDNTPGKFRAPPTLLVIHYTASTSGPSTVRTLAHPDFKASVHFVVAIDGTITQMVRCDHRANHAGASNWNGLDGCNGFSLGIEIVNPGPLHQDRRMVIYDRGGEPGGPKWEGEVVEAKHKNERCPYRWWAAYAPEQIHQVAELTRAILTAYPSVTEVVGHDDVAPWRKIDPGPAWPWEEFRRAVKRDTDRSPPPSERLT
jgi:N-acetylmuramoyl-L-alanine amidase